MLRQREERGERTREMTEVVGLDEHGALGALACARTAEDEDDSDLVVVESRS